MTSVKTCQLDKEKNHEAFSLRRRLGLVIGPLLFLVLFFKGAPTSLEVLASDGATNPFAAWAVFCVFCLMAIWWVTEAVPIAVTAMLPLILFPLLGVQPINVTSAEYMHPVVVLLMGGFIIAKAIESWGLHKRIALTITTLLGARPTMLIAGFMVSGALMSMWISNTATALMLTPIAISVADSIYGDDKDGVEFLYALLLGMAFACSIGGLGTPVGTPTNLIIIGYLNQTSDLNIGFAQWMCIGIPAVCILLPIAWFVVAKLAFKFRQVDGVAGRELLLQQKRALGKMTIPEKRTLIVFATVAFLWIFRKPLNALTLDQILIFPWLRDLLAGEYGALRPLAGLTDHVTAIIGVLLCFLIPAGAAGKKAATILDWRAAEGIPWGTVLLFGGGMSLAGAITSSGLGSWFGSELAVLSNLPTILLVMCITFVVIFLTEIMSNVATAASIMPVLGATALATGIDLELVAVPVALAASCAFMFPMATGPNAVVYATGPVPLPVMARAGVRLNLVAIFIITLISIWLGRAVLGG